MSDNEPIGSVHSYHVLTTNRDYVVDAIERSVRPYGWFAARPTDQPAEGAPLLRFYLSHVHKGWISFTDNGFFAQEELAKRISEFVPAKVILTWGEPEEAWGYQYYDEGKLEAEYVSDMWDLHREWFEMEPTPEEAGRFSGNPEKMKEVFGKLGFSLREMQEIYARPGVQALSALRDFAGQLQLENTLLSANAIEALPITERIGPRGYFELVVHQKYAVDLDSDEGAGGEGGPTGEGPDGGAGEDGAPPPA